eukprot:6824837-Prymnesium_polylepis.2
MARARAENRQCIKVLGVPIATQTNGIQVGDDGDHRVFYTPDERIMILLEEAFHKVWRSFEESPQVAKSKRQSER